MEAQYWLFKSEPDVYSIHDLERDGSTEWDGVRNYRVRNFMRDKMNVGDGVLYYHSNTDVLGVYGLAAVSGPAHPDSSQFETGNKYYDPKSDPDQPRWWCVDVSHQKTLSQPVTREAMKETPGLEEMWVLKRGMRLSITPVTKREFEIVERLGR